MSPRSFLAALRTAAEDTAERYPADEDGVRLPPRRIDLGADGVREALEFLGIFFRMRDGRVNIPDVYRVGYGLGREGGVKPSG